MLVFLEAETLRFSRPDVPAIRYIFFLLKKQEKGYRFCQGYREV
jgi:hypothetical protein